MSHTTQDLQDFIQEQVRSTDRLPADKRAHNRAYLLGVQDAFEFLTTGRTTLGLADRDVTDDNLFQNDPNKPARLPKGVTNTEPANPTVEGQMDPMSSDVANQGNDHKGEKVIDHVKRDLQQAFPQRAGDPSGREGDPSRSSERISRKR